MIPHVFTFVMRWWRWLRGAERLPASPWLVRPHLAALAQVAPASLPAFVQESTAAHTYLTLLGPLEWGNFPERPTSRLWPGPTPLPRAAFVAAYLLKLDKGLKSMKKLRDALVEQPALVWLFGFPLVPSTAYRWGFDVERSLPTPVTSVAFCCATSTMPKRPFSLPPLCACWMPNCRRNASLATKSRSTPSTSSRGAREQPQGQSGGPL
ncbi:MAG: hypothetical protein R3C14_32240 [Caldilineaceae bacterium]